MNQILEIKKGGYALRIRADESPESPREWDNFGTMALTHKRYSLPNEAKIRFDEFGTWDEVEKHLKAELEAVVILPVFMLDHSGVTISTRPFNDPWDSGRVGFIFVTRQKVIENFGAVTPETLSKSKEVLKGEVKTYDQYLQGDIYGFEIVRLKTCSECGHTSEELIDSCYGYYSRDFEKNGLLEAITIKSLQTALVKEAHG
jgi:hypothetical protein